MDWIINIVDVVGAGGAELVRFTTFPGTFGNKAVSWSCCWAILVFLWEPSRGLVPAQLRSFSKFLYSGAFFFLSLDQITLKPCMYNFCFAIPRLCKRIFLFLSILLTIRSPVVKEFVTSGGEDPLLHSLLL